MPQEPQEQVPLRQIVRRPHPAVKELRDRPGRLPMSLRRPRCPHDYNLMTHNS
ncbi:hypothetical protein AoKodu_23410 [Actinomyces oris K20]|uniref:hypothetical protein n=1 Tax=Actinomyces oris TaxID=544580 RepID=UPI000200385A|nr:hypothetical protein [Actinomyces oris]QQC39712.1 hypothetical protein I6I08_13075 [Actinomyces oris]BDG00041.1 hypothetical protein AoKodu_23410 [Actinomyces oris K20]